MITDETRTYLAAKLRRAIGNTEYLAIRADVLESLERYALRGIPPGSFLMAILENDLMEAIGRADADNLKTLKAIVTFVYMELPSSCWKSPERVNAWI